MSSFSVPTCLVDIDMEYRKLIKLNMEIILVAMTVLTFTSSDSYHPDIR